MENSSVASASSEAGSSRSQKIEELECFIDSYVLEYQVQGLLMDKMEGDGESEKTQSHISQWTVDCSDQFDGSCSLSQGKGSSSHEQSQVGVVFSSSSPNFCFFSCTVSSISPCCQLSLSHGRGDVSLWHLKAHSNPNQGRWATS